MSQTTARRRPPCMEEQTPVDSSIDQLTTFQLLRGRLFGLAYRMLGSRADAEDAVQDAYLRWHQCSGERIDSAEAWLVATTSRLAIDRLRRLRTERTHSVGQSLPDPPLSPSPDYRLSLADDLSLASLMLLERLAPEERAAFLLHDVFDVGYDQIAAVIERSEAATRQVVHRARRRVRSERKRFDADYELKRLLLDRLAAATEARDEAGLIALFAPDATWTTDGGGSPAASVIGIDGAQILALYALSSPATMH